VRPLIIGQAPSRNREAEPPLSGRSGSRLAKLAGVSLGEFLALTDRVNLVEWFPGSAGRKGDRFPVKEAEERSHAILPMCSGHRVILLGANVSRTFRFGTPPPFKWALSKTPVYAEWTLCPHPSGVNLWWNDPANVESARRFWTDLLSEERKRLGRC
jgi:uracil-DNA glycosylase